MRATRPHRRWMLLALLAMAVGCRHTHPNPALPAAGVTVTDSVVHSAILGRDMPLRLAMPSSIAPGAKLPVVLLLHGYAADYTSFSAWTLADATLVPRGYILAMPEDPSGFFLNQRGGRGRYEDYLLDEVLPAVYVNVPSASQTPAQHAIVGMSRGGFGAIVVALHHPGAFALAGAINGALDMATRPFILNEPGESVRAWLALGSAGDSLRRQDDPCALLRSVPPSQAPFFFLAWSDAEDADSAQAFAKALAAGGYRYRTDSVRGDHTWQSTSDLLPALAASLDATLHPASR